MKKGDYFAAKEAKKKSVGQGIIVLVIFIIIFIVVILRFAIRSGTNEGFFSLMPTGGNAYEVACDYVKSTLRAPDAEFPTAGFQYYKNSDSVYVVKSYYDSTGSNGRVIKTNFTVTLRYNGGSPKNDRNWSFISLQEN